MSDTNGTNGSTVPHGPPPTYFEQPAPPPKKPLTVEEMRAKTREMRVVNRYNRTLLESQMLMEAYSWSGGNQGFEFGGTDMTELWMRMRNQANVGGVPPAQPNDRRGGRKWPLWMTDASRMRTLQASRVIAGTNDYAKGYLRNSCNFTIGKGFSYKAAPKDESPFIADEDADQAANEFRRKEYLIRKRGTQKVVDAVQTWIDDFCERNNWNTAAAGDDVDDEDGSTNTASSTREREAHWRVDRDGEAIIRLFLQADGTVKVRFVDPEVVWGTPAGKSEEDGWSFGIQHYVFERVDENGYRSKEEDLERIVAYYIRPHKLGDLPKGENHDWSGEVVKASEIVHIKDPWEDAEVKHGTPVFAYDTLEAIMRATNLQRNISITSGVQAATAEVWVHKIGTKQDIQNLASGLPGAGSGGAAGTPGSNFIRQRFEPGMIRRVPAGQEPVPDPATTQVPNYMQAAQGDLRQAGASASMPEYMISGDASNANFASTQESGTPFVRSAESRQEHFKMGFLRLIRRVIRWAVKCGKLPPEALTLVKINVEGMEIHKNNEGELATARTANLAAKVTSPQIEAARLGNEWDQVKADWKEFEKDMAPAQPGGAPGGAPPQPGQQAPPAQQPAGASADDPLAGVPQADLSKVRGGAGQVTRREAVPGSEEGVGRQGARRTDGHPGGP